MRKSLRMSPTTLLLSNTADESMGGLTAPPKKQPRIAPGLFVLSSGRALANYYRTTRKNFIVPAAVVVKVLPVAVSLVHWVLVSWRLVVD